MKILFKRLLPAFLITVMMLSLPSCFAWYSDQILDNREHGLPCEALPTPAEVKQVLAEQQALVQEIEAVHSGHVFVEVDEHTCPDHADIVIAYPSHGDREKIEALLPSDTFFGVPYRLRNH